MDSCCCAQLWCGFRGLRFTCPSSPVSGFDENLATSWGIVGAVSSLLGQIRNRTSSEMSSCCIGLRPICQNSTKRCRGKCRHEDGKAGGTTDLQTRDLRTSRHPTGFNSSRPKASLHSLPEPEPLHPAQPCQGRSCYDLTRSHCEGSTSRCDLGPRLDSLVELRGAMEWCPV